MEANGLSSSPLRRAASGARFLWDIALGNLSTQNVVTQRAPGDRCAPHAVNDFSCCDGLFVKTLANKSVFRLFRAVL